MFAKPAHEDNVVWKKLYTPHDDVIKWKYFPRYWPFVRGIRWIPRTNTSDAELWFYFDLRLNKRLSKQLWSWWFKTPSHPVWRHCIFLHYFMALTYSVTSWRTGFAFSKLGMHISTVQMYGKFGCMGIGNMLPFEMKAQQFLHVCINSEVFWHRKEVDASLYWWVASLSSEHFQMLAYGNKTDNLGCNCPWIY